jgi:predicted phage baseplate assembly protein
VGGEGDIKGNQVWRPKKDLLNSGPMAREFVVELEGDGTAYLRFGDNKQGARPAQETKFIAAYRLGNGPGGNVGAGSLAHVVTNDATVIANMQENAAVWNPIAARGGTEAETMEEVKQYAPSAFRTQERAVTGADYEAFAKRCHAGIQRAAATFRWTGSWKTVFLSADRLEGLEIAEDFENELRSCLERYRMAGFDLEVDAPLPVSLEIDMGICVNSRFFASDVKQALLELFSDRILPDGRRGIFHPDNFSFGQPVYLSPLYAAAQATPGVDSVQITRFQRQGSNNNEALEKGKLLLGRREIARLHNDRNFPERGVFNLMMNGGRT